MEVILLERIPRLGQMGEVVRVKDGFARNFLLPRGKALQQLDVLVVDLRRIGAREWAALAAAEERTATPAGLW